VVQHLWEREREHRQLSDGSVGDHNNDDAQTMERNCYDNCAGIAACGRCRRHQAIEDDGTGRRDLAKYLIYRVN
jgi:hypothetical protein